MYSIVRLLRDIGQSFIVAGSTFIDWLLQPLPFWTWIYNNLDKLGFTALFPFNLLSDTFYTWQLFAGVGLIMVLVVLIIKFWLFFA